MAFMGYKNADRVYPLARQGKLAIYRDGRPRLDDRLLNVLMYMALRAKSKEDYRPGKTEKSRMPYWCYWGGNSTMASEMGMLFSPEMRGDLGEATSDEAVDSTAARMEKATKRISELHGILEKRGVIKKLVKASNFTGTNNVWLLLLGTPEENAEAERIAKAYYGLQ
ncbi:hypothetical protein [Bifidobacterium olomucense]|uniref:Uncharacterized protein n=1 Tax=Bifidobacterium olomucense TaxID=2675324 RepID=A0A7Y0EXH2_9BIFI|nr:hypothetical protein [Bifidobacterium sp. DSM 109959]NMM98169.1 hypothetical protein [Bifidobacterium sp. DSM 109959]